MRRSKWNCAGDLFDVRASNVHGLDATAAALEVLALDDAAHVLIRFAMQRPRTADGFEAVVLGRIMAAGDHDGPIGIQVLRRKIQHRCRNRADIGNVAAGG